MSDTTTIAQKKIARAELKPVAADANAYLETIQALDVVDEETAAQCADMRHMLSNLKKKIEAKKRLATDPLNESIKEIRSWFAPAIKNVDDALDETKRKLDAYARQQAEIEAAQIEADKKAALKAQAEAEKDADELRKSGAAEVADAVEQSAAQSVAKFDLPMKSAPVRGARATLSRVTTWKARVYSVKELCKAIGRGQLPTNCVDPKQSVLDSLALEQKKEISENGVEFYKHISSAVR